MSYHVLDLSLVTRKMLLLSPTARADAIAGLVRSADNAAALAPFISRNCDMSAAEEAATVLIFVGGGGVLASLFALIGYAAFAASWQILATVIAILVGLAVHPIPLSITGLPTVLTSPILLLLFRYFSFRVVWTGGRDLREREKASGVSLAYAIPHGVFPFGNLLSVPALHLLNIRFVGTSADVVHSIPVMRWLTCLGVVSASKATILRHLDRGTHVGLVPDGIAGIFYTRDVNEVVPVRSRMGAAKLALENGLTLQPAYLFGNTLPYSVWYDSGGHMMRWSRRLRVMLAIIWGRWGLPVPRRVPITFALGDALVVPKAEGAVDDAAVAKVHGELLERLQQTFGRFAEAYGWSGQDGRKLEFV